MSFVLHRWSETLF